MLLTEPWRTQDSEILLLVYLIRELVDGKSGNITQNKLKENENGKEKCTKCGAEDYFCNWLYTNAPKNQKIDYHKQNAALTHLVGLDDNDVDRCFWLNLKASLNYQKKTFPNRFI